MPKSKERRLRCVYHFIVTYCLEMGGRPPTIRRIAEACHLSSTSVAHSCVQALIRRGLLTAPGGTARWFYVTGSQWRVPLFCPQCKEIHNWGSLTNEWSDIVEECING